MSKFGLPARANRSFAAATVCCSVIGKKGRNFERYPPVDAACLLVNGPKQVGGSGEILQCQAEEQRFPGFAPSQSLAYGGVIGAAVLDGVIENGGI